MIVVVPFFFFNDVYADEISFQTIKKYDEWIAKNPEKPSIKKLKEAVEWRPNEIMEDYHHLEEIPNDDNVTNLAGFNNITVTSMLFGIVEGYYIKKLESQLENQLERVHLRKQKKNKIRI